MRYHTLDSLVEKLDEEGLGYRPSTRRFCRAKLHTMLKDRSYIGEVLHKGERYPGKQEPIIDRSTWNRVQKLFGGRVYHSHELTYAAGLIRCGHCGHYITGEQVREKRKEGGDNIHVY